MPVTNMKEVGNYESSGFIRISMQL